MRKMQPICKARQRSDQMQCDQCGVTWDVNDPEPPACAKMAAGTAALLGIRNAIHSIDAFDSTSLKLLELKEMPLNHLPTFGIPDGLRKVNWPSMPRFAFVLVGHLPGILEGVGRVYTFFDEKGLPVTEVIVEETLGAHNSSRRDWIGGKYNEWVTA